MGEAKRRKDLGLPIRTIETNYIIYANEKYKGVVEVEKSIWDYATAEFSNDLQVGVPQDPVLERVIELKKFPISIKNDEISYWTVFPTDTENQKKYLGMYLDEKGKWIDEREEN